MHPSEFCFPDIPGQETPPAICNKNIWIITGHQPSQRKGIWYTQASRRNNRINSRLLVARWVRVRLRRVLIHYRPLINLPRVEWLTRKCWKLYRASLKCIKVYDVENSVYVVRPVNAVNVINFASLDKKMMYYMENYKKSDTNEGCVEWDYAFQALRKEGEMERTYALGAKRNISTYNNCMIVRNSHNEEHGIEY